MTDPEVMMTERNFLMESTRQIQQRISEYNKVADPSSRIEAENTPSWLQRPSPVRVVNKYQNGPEVQARSTSFSRVGQHPGNTPASYTRGVTQPAREGGGFFDPAAAATSSSNKSQTQQELMVNDWPALHSQGAGPKNNVGNGKNAGKGKATYVEVRPRSNTTAPSNAPQGRNDASSPMNIPRDSFSPPSAGPPPEEESVTQFEAMGKRNPTWAEVTKLNIKRLDPFAKFADLLRVKEVEAAEIEEILDGLISNSLPVENVGVKEEDIVEIDPGFLVSSTRYLKENSVVIYTMDLKVSFKYVESWTETVFRQTLGVKINGICSLSRNCYQVVFESSRGRNHVFANAPFYLGESMVYTLPWDPRFNPRELRTSKPLKEEKFFRIPGFRNKLDPQFRPPAFVDNRFGILHVDEEDPDAEDVWENRFEGAEEDEEMEGNPDDPNEEQQPGPEAEVNSENRNVSEEERLGEKERSGETGDKGGDSGSKDCPMIPEDDDNFRTFEEAERSNARKQTRTKEELMKMSGGQAAKKQEKKSASNPAGGNKPVRQQPASV
ncbi:hypothetical protein R1sor_005682 [Riccia sorocarpa]|uniref:DUF4283 domain-containing protein n=1 Tax=Riccia sorocarpa TaxID=122646 RepID=A0ABD3HMK3_9MARC